MSRFEAVLVVIYSGITVYLLDYNLAFVVLTPLLVTVIPLAIAYFVFRDIGFWIAVAVAVIATVVIYIVLAQGAVYIAKEGDKLLFYLWPIVWLRVGWNISNQL